MTITTMLIRLLTAIAGDILTTYLLPLITDPARKDWLSKVAPVAKYFVGIAEQSSLKGQQKKAWAAEQIAAKLKDEGLAVQASYIDTGIQIAYHALGLDKK